MGTKTEVAQNSLKDEMDNSILTVEGLQKYFPIRGGILNRVVGNVKAVDNISFQIKRGETFGIVGESGSGKSTLGKTILGLHQATAGKVYFENQEITSLGQRGMKQYRREMQMVFQDPYASLNPRLKVEELIMEPMIVHNYKTGAERKRRLLELLDTVGLQKSAKDKYPHEFSGGQRQRIGIARALAINPQIIIADEPVSALDVSIQSQVLNLMKDLQKEYNLTYIFISHDLSVVKYISDRVAVMYLGKLMELGHRDDLFMDPKHPYTKSLLSAIPIPNPHIKRERIILKGDIPDPTSPPSGCVFRTRCPFSFDRCKVDTPTLANISGEHFVACHLYDNAEGIMDVGRKELIDDDAS